MNKTSHLRLLGGGRPTRPTQPRPLNRADARLYADLRTRLTVAQAIDVVTGRDDHGCSVRERAVLRLVVDCEQLPAAA